ncbi:MAG: CHAT domain-containing protein [Candidatus Thiodiazotropha endolucinida]
MRKGPPHNQLLSPLTEYLGICGDAGAGPVSIPYEQAAFNAVLEELRYVDFDEEDQAPRQRALRTLGRDIGEVLGSVPGFTGSLAQQDSCESLLNLRIIASASELARLPFELAKMPSGSGRSTNDWLALQSDTPVCFTRCSRTVQTHDATWRQDAIPRVLYIIGLDIPEELARRHREVLMEALAPWDSFKVDNEYYSQKCLVEMGPYRGATLPTVEAIRKELESGYSYIHILAHGAESQEAEALTYGLYLPGAVLANMSSDLPSTEITDVVTGNRFASMLSSIPCEKRPSVVFTASCDSANQGNLLVPGGSFAQALHEAAVPLVVASQFPLTTEGSVTLTRAFYEDLFWGKEPLPTLMRARAKLHADYGDTHDWASVVVYDGLPNDLLTQALACRYERAKRALGHAQDVIVGITKQADVKFKDPVKLAERALDQLPNQGGYEREREGLIASHAKLLAMDAYNKGREEKNTQKRRSLFIQTRAYLEQARRHYHSAARDFLDPGNAKQLQATLHWVLTQAICLDRLLGDSGADLGWGRAHVDAFSRTPEQQAWDLSFQSATVAAQSKVDDVWGHGSLAELWLLKLFEDLSDTGVARAKELAEHHATRMAQLSVGSDSFPVYSTKRQLNRYVVLWTEDFRRDLGLLSKEDNEEDRWPEVREEAKKLVAMLTRFDTEPED